MNNGTKIVIGSLLGSGIGYVMSKVMEHEVAEPVGLSGAAAEPRESFKDRWQRAKVAGEGARLAKEAELRAYFREKVNDPVAFTSASQTETPPIVVVPRD